MPDAGHAPCFLKIPAAVIKMIEGSEEEQACRQATIVFWSHALNWLGFRYPLIQRLVHPPPLKLIEDGRLLRRNIRRELVTEDEILGQVRLQGINDLLQVEEAFMEGDGRISVVARNGKNNGNTDRIAV